MASVAASGLGFAVTRLRRALRSGELRILALALMVAATAAVAVGLFADRVRIAIESGTGDQLGADAVLRGRDAPPPELVERLRATGLKLVRVTEFPSVVARVDGQDTQLASIKAVESGYPLRGALTLSREPFGSTFAAPPVPPKGEVWVEQKLWTVLSLSAGAKLQVGSATLAVGAIIAEQPGRGGGFGDLAPDLLLNADDLPATQLVSAGSRVEVMLQLAGTREQLAAAKAIPLPRGFRLVTPEDERPEIRQSLKRARSFLNISVLATILLAAAAVGLSARQYSGRLRDEVALLKTLGARRAFLQRALVAQIVLLGLAAGALGAFAGVAAQEVIARIAGPALGVNLPWPGLIGPALTMLAAMLLVLLLLAGFALPPVLAAVETTPVAVFQRAAGQRDHTRWSVAAGVLAVGALLLLLAGEVKLAGIVLLGAAATAGVLAFCAWVLVRSLGGMRRRAGIAWRFGLGNIARRKGAAVAQIVALGVALLALLLVTVVRQDLLSTWKNKLPPDTPNEFLVNIQPEQLEPLKAFFATRGFKPLEPHPLVRSRLTAVNGKPVAAESFNDPETRRWINREFNLSWTDHFDTDNVFKQGQAWGPEAAGKPWLAVDEYAVEHLKLKLGDTLTMDFAGESKTLEVRAVRDIKWDSFKPNFFLVTPPGVLEQAPVQWIASFYLPAAQRGLLRELIREFPNVTALDLDAALNKVRSITDRIVHALEFIFLFTLAAGLIVMLAVIEGSRAERRRETGVLRTLGASSKVLVQGLVAEYAVLGLLAGTVAAFAAQALAWGLARFVFEIDYGPSLSLWLAGSLAGAAIVAVSGWLSLRKVLKTPPQVVLATEN